MKIAYLCDAIYPFVKGGAQKRAYEISKRLAKRGHEVHTFGLRWWGEAQTTEKDGVFLHGVCGPRSLYVKGRRSIGEAITFGGTLFPHLLRGHFDVIDCYQSPYLHCYTAKIASIAKRTPLIFSWYEVWSDYWYEYLGFMGIFGKLVERSVLKLPHRIIVAANQTKRDLISVGCKSEKISVVPNGVDYGWIRDTSPSQEKFDVIYVGRLIKGKNVDLLIQSVNLLKNEFPKLKVGIIGDGPEKPRLEKLAEELDITNNVRFFGFIEDFTEVVALEKSSKMFVIPSTQEGGSSIVSLEANACGLPVIAVRHKLGISAELITESNGFLVELSPKAIADKIHLLLTDVGLREEMGKSATSFAKQYDWDKITDLIEEVYGQVAR